VITLKKGGAFLAMRLIKSLVAALLVVVSGISTAYADTTIVNETFDSYVDGGGLPDQAAFEANWRPDNGDGIPDFLDPTNAGFLVPDQFGIVNPPNDNPPGLQGVGVASIGTGINESNATFSLMPSATQWIRFGGDIFNDGPITNDSASGMRQSIALRNDNYDRDPATFGCQCGTNFLELGFYNTTAPDPITGVDRPNTQFQYRIALFSRVQPGNIALPNWLSFNLDPALDKPSRPYPDGDYNDDGKVDAADYVVWRENAGTSNVLTNDPLGGTIGQAQYDQWRANFGAKAGDGIVDINDIGAGWHSFSALIKPDSITVELDLYRDGINNATGLPGVDASETWPAQMDTIAGVAGAFNSLRFGPPSGISGNDHAVFDNIFLKVIDVPPGSGTSLASVPEPNSLVLVWLGIAALISMIQHRRK
jgi:hypothetical protein